jgi:hypothetical protein
VTGAIADSPRRRPIRVAHALIALAGAWTVSAGALFVNQALFHGAGIGPGPSLGVISLVLQVAMMLLVAHGAPGARLLAVLFLILAALPLQMLPRLVGEHSLASAAYLALGFALKAIAVWLLFTGDSPAWFVPAERRASGA